jgi:two-component system aerobic respiration control protein ArcA
MKKINTKDLVEKIERITRSKMVHQEVVPLESFRELKKKIDPKVILIVEDDESMRAALKRILEQETSYLVKIASDATELARVLDDKAIDLLLLDIGLPWIDGFELGQILKEHKDLRYIPLVYISGHVTDTDLKKAFEIGASEFFQKPFDPDKLFKTVKHLLSLPQGPQFTSL